MHQIDIILNVLSASITHSNTRHKWIEVELKDIDIQEVVEQIDLENMVKEIGATQILEAVGIEEMIHEIGIKKISEMVGQEVIDFIEHEKQKKIEEKSW